jgi:hypothetical protein
LASRAPILAAFAAAACACGPVSATSVISDAEAAVARAHAADGDRYATYETTSADLYLQKAREEQGAAQYGVAIGMARKSAAYADEAARKSTEAKKGGAAPTPADAPARRVVKPGDAPPEETGKPAPPAKVNQPVKPAEGAPPGDGSRRVIKPGEGVPGEAPPKRQPKAPIEVEEKK